MHMNMPRTIAAAGASLCLASGRAEPESPDTSSLELLRAVRGVRLAAIECGVQVTAFHEEFQIVESMPIGQPLGGTALFFVDSASGDWRTVTAIEGVGMTDVIITSDSIIQAASSLTGVGTVGQLPGEMHPTSAMMLPNPLLLCVIHLLPVSTENVSTQPTWRDLAGVEAPAGLDWIPSDPSSAGPPRESGEQMLVAEFDGGELDGESLVYRVWRLAGTHRPVRTELWGAGGALLTRIDFEYDSGVAEWPRSVEIVEWQDGQAAARSTIEVTSLVLNDPSAFPAQVWTQDFSACASVLDYTSGIVEEATHGP